MNQQPQTEEKRVMAILKSFPKRPEPNASNERLEEIVKTKFEDLSSDWKTYLIQLFGSIVVEYWSTKYYHALPYQIQWKCLCPAQYIESEKESDATRYLVRTLSNHFALLTFYTNLGLNPGEIEMFYEKYNNLSKKLEKVV